MQPSSLAQLIGPCGPTVDEASSRRAFDVLVKAADAQGWRGTLELAWPCLKPAVSASPYLNGLARQDPLRLRRVLEAAPEARLDALLASAVDVARCGAPETAPRDLRRLKAELHLLTALADLGGAWTLDEVTGALSGFADAAVQAALGVVARDEQAHGRLLAPVDDGSGPVPGLFCLALGKHGAFELNYSSDIDVSVFYAPERLPVSAEADPHRAAVRITQAVAAMLQARTSDGYVFRVDLRLRPDPSSTPPAMPVDAALGYYQSAGQNWERAAMIKARPCAGDRAQARAFLDELRPFIWRRSLDYASIADIHAIKRQIHVHKVDERLSAPGHNLKLGAGGIREIEFFVQTQQLILGGRDPALRAPRTLDALTALVAAGQVGVATAKVMTRAYVKLRALEHRVQMIADEQTHVLPESDPARQAVAALYGYASLTRFDSAISRLLRRVNARYGALFANDEPLSSSFGSLVFTGVEDDPETLLSLERMGFSQPHQISSQIRAWHHGRIPATRTERGRELFTRLAPRLLEATQATGSPDIAFARFANFFSRLSTGVQIQSLLLARPKLFELIVEVMAYAPQLAATLARQPGTLDAMLDSGYFAPIEAEPMGEMVLAAVGSAGSFETAMAAARRAHGEQAFRIGLQVISGAAQARQAGQAFASLAEACIAALSRPALAEVERLAGVFPGEVAVVALGKTGSREMTAGSDLDLITLYDCDAAASSSLKGWSSETFYSRFTQRLMTALSAPTVDGRLYTVDLQLRPSGRAGPVAVSLGAFIDYHGREAETWEAMALTRAQVIWASSAAIGERTSGAIQAVLRRPRDPKATAADVLDMRELLARERPAQNLWDLKFHPGGLVDIEFATQFLQLLHAASGGPLRANTGEALAKLREAGLASDVALNALEQAWRLQQDLSQILKLAIVEAVDPEHEPERFKMLISKAGGARSFPDLIGRLKRAQARAHRAFESVVRAPGSRRPDLS